MMIGVETDQGLVVTKVNRIGIVGSQVQVVADSISFPVATRCEGILRLYDDNDSMVRRQRFHDPYDVKARDVLDLTWTLDMNWETPSLPEVLIPKVRNEQPQVVLTKRPRSKRKRRRSSNRER